MLISEGAMQFAEHCGVIPAPEKYFYTPDRVEQLKKAQRKHKIMLDHDDTDEDSEDQKYGTIGAIARDGLGNLAAATSTGGIVNNVSAVLVTPLSSVPVSVRIMILVMRQVFTLYLNLKSLLVTQFLK